MNLKFLRQYKNYLPILLVLVVAAFLRLYRISDQMTFLGDEGRDATVWLRMVRDGKFTLIGPTTSIGNMYLGPLYYYLMFPFFLLFGLSPVGPSVGVALFSILTTFLIWWIGKEWFGRKVGLVASFLYSISPVVIMHSRSSWNPNVMPFFSLLTIWGIWQFWQNRKFIWLFFIGISLSFAIQSHYLGLLLIPLVMFFWFMSLFQFKSQSKLLERFLLFSLLGVLVFLALTIAPLVWFDLRHDFLNYRSFYKFFSDRQTTVNFKFYKAIPNLWPLWEMTVTRLLGAKEILWGKVIAMSFFVALVPVVLRCHLPRGGTSLETTKGRKALALILIWLIVSLVGLGLYKQHIYDHYFGFLFPAVFILAGLILSTISNQGKPGKLLSFAVLVGLVILNWRNLPLKDSPNYQMRRVQEVDEKVIAESAGKPFNFALIAKRNYEAGYVFYLEYWQSKPKEIDAQRISETLTDQLFVVCEDLICEPLNNPKAGVANFGWAKVEQQWEFPWGVKLFKLVHNTKN